MTGAFYEYRRMKSIRAAKFIVFLFLGFFVIFGASFVSFVASVMVLILVNLGFAAYSNLLPDHVNIIIGVLISLFNVLTLIVLYVVFYWMIELFFMDCRVGSFGESG